jgi:hypothetical protein
VTAALLLVLFLGTRPAPEEISYRVVDRREIDGSVLLVRQVRAENVGDQPFTAAVHWELRPVTHFFRVREGRIPARRILLKIMDPPAVTYRAGQVVGNNWTNAFGGEGATFFEKGEIVRLVNLNAAFSSVRMDLEAVCRDVGRHLQGRVEFGLSGQIGGKTFDEANAAVRAILEPMDLSRVMETCDPENGQPPFVVAPGGDYAKLRKHLGEPRLRDVVDGAEVIDHLEIRVVVRAGRIEKIIVPTID